MKNFVIVVLALLLCGSISVCCIVAKHRVDDWTWCQQRIEIYKKQRDEMQEQRDDYRDDAIKWRNHRAEELIRSKVEDLIKKGK